MKRLLVAVFFALLPAGLLAQEADRDILLTPDGTLYTVESVINDGAQPTEVSRYLTLTIQPDNAKPQTIFVPDSLTAGTHWHPALAWDNASQTLFVFWLKMPNAMSSELLLSSYSKGSWQPAISLDVQQYRLRYNLKIAITRYISQLQPDGSYKDMPMLVVHAAWWEETGYGDGARYALMGISNGTVISMSLYDLNDFGPPYFVPSDVAPDFNREILKHPAFADNGSPDSIDVIFGDSRNNNFDRVTLKPVADGRIHIPIGFHPGGPTIGPPRSFSAAWTGQISTITSPRDTGKLLLYNSGTNAVSYIVYSSNSWSAVKTLPLSDRLSAEAAVSALSRMMSQ